MVKFHNKCLTLTILSTNSSHWEARILHHETMAPFLSK